MATKPTETPSGAFYGTKGEDWLAHEAVTTPNVDSLFDMSGRVCLVTGGCGWLGSAFCLALAEVGATVIVSSRNLERAQAHAKRLPTPKGDVQAHAGVCIDHLSEQSITDGFQQAVGIAGGVDVLINNAVAVEPGDINTATFDSFAKTQRNNAGLFFLARLLRDHCVQRKSKGSIVNIGSMYGQVASYPDAYTHTNPIGDASPISYHCLKGGTIHMTRHMAAYWAEDKIRVNCLSPGAFPSPKAPQSLVERLNTKLPMKRMGLPSELKGPLLLLASEAGSYMTGVNLTVDGGWTCW